MSTTTSVLRIVIVGHVDHGKSTLIGRLLADTGAIPPVRLEEVRATCERQGRPFEYAYLMDALEEEREHNVTIDTTQTWFKSARRDYVIIDAPGHKEFLKNMITGASSADAALLLVDGEEGVREQTRRHAYLLAMLGISQVTVVVNKLDLVGFARARFDQVADEARRFLHSIGVTPAFVVPLSAREGDNLVKRSQRSPWYDGPTLLEALDGFEPAAGDGARPARLPIQDVYKWDDRRRYVGRVEAGRFQRGQAVRFMPSGRTSRIREIERWPERDLPLAVAGACVGISLVDEVFVEPGEVMAPLGDEPAAATEVRANLFWLGREPLKVGASYGFKLGTADARAEVVSVEERLDPSTLEVVERYAETVRESEVGRVVLRLAQPVAGDAFESNPRLGRFVLVDGGVVSGGGMVRQLGQAGQEGGAREIRLHERLRVEPSGMVIDLRGEVGDLEIRASEEFLARLRAGERTVFRFSGLRPFQGFLRWAYESFLAFELRREDDGLWVMVREKSRAGAREPMADGI